MTVHFDQLYDEHNPTTSLAYTVRDLWGKADVGSASCCITVALAPHASRFLRLTPNPSAVADYACGCPADNHGALHCGPHGGQSSFTAPCTHF